MSHEAILNQIIIISAWYRSFGGTLVVLWLVSKPFVVITFVVAFVVTLVVSKLLRSLLLSHLLSLWQAPVDSRAST